MSTTTKQFGGVLPEKRLANIAGVKVDVSRIPARLMLELKQLLTKDIGPDGTVPPGTDIDITEVTSVVAKICQLSDAQVTEDFLLDNLDIDELTALVEYIIEPVLRKAEANKAAAAEGEGKNP